MSSVVAVEKTVPNTMWDVVLEEERDLSSSVLLTATTRVGKEISMLGARRSLDVKEQACWARLVYGIYMATNRARNADHATRSADCAVEEVIQFIRRSAEGHRKTLKLLGSLWTM